MNFAQRISQEGTAVRKAKRHGMRARRNWQYEINSAGLPAVSRIAAALR